MQKINRRNLLKNAALAGISLTAGAGVLTSRLSPAMASSYESIGGLDHSACAHNHHALGHKLSTLIADPKVEEAVKNYAIKTAACPNCGTGIAPTGLGLAAKTWTA